MELIISAIVAIQVQRVAIMVYDFVRARYWQFGDHGVKAQGDGWLTSVSLVEGENIALPDSGTPSPYVVFTCNGKDRTSSVKLRTMHPIWREIFEFNATDDPPTTMDVEVFDYDGPFFEAQSLGHAEIRLTLKLDCYFLSSEFKSLSLFSEAVAGCFEKWRDFLFRGMMLLWNLHPVVVLIRQGH